MKVINNPKILLLNPPFFDHGKYGKTPQFANYPSTGLFYLYSYLKKNNYFCKIYDFYFNTWDEIVEVVKKENADIIGITCVSESRYNSFRLLQIVRRIKKDTIVIFGGHHSTYMYKQLLENFNIDYIVLGEGEIKLLNLIRAIEGKQSINSVKGIAYNENGKIIKNEINEDLYISDLDDLPFPFSEEHLSIFEKYIEKTLILGKKNKKICIITSRGCPFSCQYCSSTLFWGKKWRFRTSKNVVDEIEYYYRNLGFRNFVINDDTFTVLSKRVEEICNDIINRQLKINFTCMTRVDRLNDDLIKLLKEAGCVIIFLGIESGSKKILRNINKNINYKSIFKAFTLLKKYNLYTDVFLMVGNPGESKATIEETKNLLKIIKPNNIEISITQVYPGSQLYELAKKQGFIDDDYWLTEKPSPHYTYENSLSKLKKWVYEINNYNKKYSKIKSKFISLFFIIYYNTLFPYSIKKIIKNFYTKKLNKFIKLL